MMLVDMSRARLVIERHRDRTVRIGMRLGARGEALGLGARDEELFWPFSLGSSRSRGVVSKEARSNPEGDGKSSAIANGGKLRCVAAVQSPTQITDVVLRSSYDVQCQQHIYLNRHPTDDDMPPGQIKGS